MSAKRKTAYGQYLKQKSVNLHAGSFDPGRERRGKWALGEFCSLEQKNRGTSVLPEESPAGELVWLVS